MTLQEKIDQLPLNIEYHRKTYILRFGGKAEYIYIEYFNANLLGDYRSLLEVYNEDLNKTLSQRLEDVVDRALKVIENKEWEK